MPLPIQPVKPVYDDSGSLVGIEDPNEQRSRLPTPQERLMFTKPKTRGGGGHRQPTTPAPEVKLPPSASYVEEAGGVVTSEGTVYKTTNKNYLPKGYVQGFADVREQAGLKQVVVIPKAYTSYAQSTKEGVSVSLPAKPVYSDTGKSMSPEYQRLGNTDIYIKVPQQPQPKQKLSVFGVSVEGVLPKIVRQKVLDREIKTRAGKMTVRESLLYSPSERKATGKETFFQKLDIPTIAKGILFAPLMATRVDIYSSLYASQLALKNSRTSFRAVVKQGGEFSEVDLISATRYNIRKSYDLILQRQVIRSEEAIGFSKLLVKELEGGDAGLIFGRTGTVTPTVRGMEIKELVSAGVVKDLGTAKVIKPGKVKVSAEAGTGQVSKGVFGVLRGLELRNVYDVIPGRFRTIRKPIKNTQTEEANILAGVYKNVGEGKVTYAGTTNPLLRQYTKKGLTNPFKNSVVIREVNIKGIITFNSMEEAFFKSATGVKTLTKKSLSPGTQRQITKALNSIIGDVGKQIQAKQSINSFVKFPRSAIGTQRQSLYYGTGQYETTEGYVMPLQMPKQQTVYLGDLSTSVKVRSSVLSLYNTAQPNRSRRALKTLELVRQEPRQTQSPTLTFKEKTIQKSRFNLMQRATQINTPKPRSFGSLNNPRTPIPIPPATFKYKGKMGKMFSKIFGFKTFYLKKGKRVYLPGVREKGQAIRYGEAYTLKTLRATFGIKRTGKKLAGIETTYKPSSSLFRSYRIKKGRRVPLQDTFIQVRGKRLSYAGEIGEIQQARRMKGGLI